MTPLFAILAGIGLFTAGYIFGCWSHPPVLIDKGRNKPLDWDDDPIDESSPDAYVRDDFYGATPESTTEVAYTPEEAVDAARQYMQSEWKKKSKSVRKRL